MGRGCRHKIEFKRKRKQEILIVLNYTQTHNCTSNKDLQIKNNRKRPIFLFGLESKNE